MPRAGKRWFLITINTHASWLHGDPRGFRSREHRIHSSGDYKNPPPRGEHARLHRYQVERSASKTTLDPPLRPLIGRALRDALHEMGHEVLAVSVSSDHPHMVVELPDQRATVRQVIGQAKRKSSRAVKSTMPGTVWSAGCDMRLKDTPEALREAVDYVRERQGAGSWTWSFRDEDGASR